MLLQKAGYENAGALLGGMSAWEAAGNKVIRTDAPPAPAAPAAAAPNAAPPMGAFPVATPKPADGKKKVVKKP